MQQGSTHVCFHAAVQNFFGLSEVVLVDGSQLVFDERDMTLRQFQDGETLRICAKGQAKGRFIAVLMSALQPTGVACGSTHCI
jgi:hypothetical protein